MVQKHGFPSNVSPMVEAFREGAGITDKYSILAVKRGDCVVGYKIRHNPTNRLKGARLYTLEAAREMREFYCKHFTGYCVDYEIVE